MQGRAASSRSRNGGPRAIAAGALGAALAGLGCNAQLDPRAIESADIGRYGPVAARLSENLESDPSNRDYLLSRVRVLLMTLADGQPEAGEVVANQTFNLLRTQGVNADKTVSAVVVNEGVRIWKGEPFEQALAYNAIAVQKAMRGEWDNARAAAGSSLFLLKDFARSEGKADLTMEELTRQALERERRADAEAAEDKDYLDHGYAAVPTDFALGYLMSGIANRALARPEEADDHFVAAARVNPGLKQLAGELRQGAYDTVLLVDYGRGPAKVAYGPDNALTRWMPRTPSGERVLHVDMLEEGGEVQGGEFPIAQDVNEMAASHRWNNLEDVRKAKSTIGTVLLAGGLIAATRGNANDETKIVGASLAALGLLMKAGSGADTRFAEFLPQSTYVVPLDLPEEPVTVRLTFDGGRRVLLPGMKRARDGDVPRLRYVRVAPGGEQAWEQSGKVVYANDQYEGEVAGEDLPFIFGGRCVRRPSPEVMDRYHRAGHLRYMTQVDLENLYREEGITFEALDQKGLPRRHVLDGGTSLACPLAGTAGFLRLFCQEHEPYEAKSSALREAASAERARAGETN